MSGWKLFATVAALSMAALAGAQDAGASDAGASDAHVAEEFTRSFDVQAAPELYVRNPDGLVLIRSSSTNKITVHAKKEVWRARDAEEAKKEASKVRLEISEFANEVRIEIHHPNRVMSFGGHPEVVVRLEIEAPSNTGIDAGVSDGELNVEGFEGKMRLSTSDGQVDAKHLSGEVEILASDGKIRAEHLSGDLNLRVSDGDLIATNCSGKMKVRASDGTVRMEAVNGALDASASDGDIMVEGKLTSVTGRVSDGTMEIEVAAESVMEGDWNLQSSDGDIVLTLPQAFSAEVQISAADGNIHTDHPIQVTGSLNNRKWSGRMGQGGHTIAIRTSDGDIALR